MFIHKISSNTHTTCGIVESAGASIIIAGNSQHLPEIIECNLSNPDEYAKTIEWIGNQ